MLTAQWNTGYLIGMWVTIILTGIGLVGAILCGVTWWRGRKTYTDLTVTISGPGFIGFTAIFIIAGIVGTIVAFPFSGVYHRYQPISGTVTQNVDSRFLSDGSGSTQNFLVSINGQNYRCDDTRCAQLQKGMAVTLMCEKSFQFNATSGWVCNWGKLGKND